MLLTEFNNTRATFYFAKPKDLNLPKGTLENKFLKQKKDFSIQLHSDVLQKEVLLFSKVKGHFPDNFFNLMSGETKVIIYTSDEET